MVARSFHAARGVLAFVGIRALLTLTFAATVALSVAPAADLDSTFDPDARTFGLGFAVATQPDGKVLAGGLFSRADRGEAANLARFNADGTIDPTFNVGASLNGTVRCIAVQSDGKIVIGGVFTAYGATSRNSIARLNADGSLDTTFNPGTGFNGEVIGLALQSDGKVVAVGAFTSFNGNTRNRVARLTTAGALDTTFAPTTGANDIVWDVALQANGQAIIVGRFTTYNGTARNRIARLTAAGALDTAFNPGTGANSDIVAIAIDSAGRPVIGGFFSTFNGTARQCLARLTTAGALDSTFGATAVFSSTYDTISDLKLDSAERILVAGDFAPAYQYNYNPAAPGLVRVSGDGNTIDESFFVPEAAWQFNRPGMSFRRIQSIAVTPDDGVLAAGGMFDTVSGQAGLLRVTNTGARDATFNSRAGLWFPPYINAVRPGLGGKFYVAGLFDWIGGTRRVDLARYLPNAKIDSSFAAYDGNYTDNQITEVLELPNGNVWAFGPFTKLGSQTRSGAALFDANGNLSYASPLLAITGGNVVRALATASGDLALAGTFTQVNATARAGVARVTAAGALDTAFAPGTGPAGGTIADAALDASGRLIVGGAFTSFSGTAEANLVRLSTAGAVDTAFAANTDVSAAVNSVQVQTDGKILLGGIFANSGGYVFNGTTLLNADGTPDLTFNPYPGANSYVYRARRAADGTVLVAGAFNAMQDQPRPMLARLTANGPVDSLFAADTVAGGYPSDFLELPDGKILVRGTFTAIDGATRHGLARFHSAPVRRGGLESAMNAAALASGTVSAVVPLADGRFVVAGDFTTFSGTARLRVAAIDVYGQIDPTFAYTNGCNGAVLGGALDANGKILLWGSFTSYNGTSAPGLVRLNADGSVDATFAAPVFNAAVNAVLLQPDGRLLVGGGFSFAGATPAGGLVRLQAGGAVDSAFNAGSGANGAILALARASDGSVFAGGAFTSFAGSAAPGVVKLNATGARASGFDLGAGNADSSKPVRALAVVSGDKLLVGGSFTAWAGASVGGLVRLNADGSRDSAFLGGLGADGAVHAFAALADGRLYVGGAFTTLGGGERRGLLRLAANGTIDPVFDVGTGFSGEVRALAVVADGRVAAGGTFTAYGGVARNRLAVLFGGDSPSYTLPGDQIFVADVNPGNPFSVGYGDAISGLRYQWYRDGVLIPGATGASYAVASAGLGDMGLYTLTFSNGSGEYSTQGWRVTVKLAPVISGAPLAQAVGYGASATFTVGAAGPGPFTYQWYRNGVAITDATGSSYTLANVGDTDFGATFFVRITNTYGSTDSTPVTLTFDTAAVPGALTLPFTGASTLNGSVQAVVRTAGGQYYVGGSGLLRRLNADGTVDSTFAPTLTQLTATALALQSDGKLIVAGSMVTNGVTYGLVRLLSSGAVDPTFAPVTVVQSSASYATQIAALALQSDGKILLGGYFDTVAGTTRRYLARLNTNGSVDTTLAPTSDATGPNDVVSRIVVQGTNVIIAGAFTAYRGAAANRLARFIGGTGANDTTFAGGTRADGTILGLVAQTDGKLIVHGNFTAYNGTTRNKLARLNADGSLDTAFDPGSGPAVRAYYDSPSIVAAVPSDNGTVIVLGLFDSFSGWPVERSVRLTSTGAIDTQWASPNAGSSSFSALFALGDGSLFVSGSVMLSNGSYAGFARLLSGSYPPQAPAIARAPVAPGSGVAAGTRVELSALASGRGTLAFQWYRGATALTNSTTVTGATSPVLTLRSIRADEAGAYKLRVTSSTNGSVETTPVSLTVDPELGGPGSLDLTWAADPLPRDATVFGFAADGSAIASFYDNYNNPSRSYLRKYDANGVLQPAATFASGAGFTGFVRTLLVQSDGKVIAIGAFDDAFGVTARNYIARVNANGTYDSAYTPTPDNQILDAVLQSDGKLIVAGYFATVTGTSRAGVARLTTAGAVDTTFVPGAHGLTGIRFVRLATDTANLGKVYIVGYNSTTNVEEIVRLTAAGAIDGTFTRASFASGSVSGLALDSAGRLLLVGSFTSISGQPRKTIARLTTTGALDPTFGITRSAGASASPSSLAIGADGYIYLSLDTGASATFDGFPTGPIVRVDATAGQFDVNFPGSGRLRVDNLSESRLTWVGAKLALTGFISGAPRSGYVRLNVTGGPTGAPVLADSSGNRTIGDGTTLTLFARFAGAGPLTYVWRRDGAVLAGATGPQLIVTGASSADAGTYTVTATNASGSATATMNVSFFAADPLAPVGGITLASNFNGGVGALSRVADGSVLAGGTFTTVDGVPRRGLARFTSAGVLDTAFNNALPFSTTAGVSVNATLIEPDGRILVLGNLGLSDGSTAYLVRLNSNGSLASVLLNSTNTTGGSPVRMARQSDGQIVLFGSFTTIAGVARSKLARISVAGVLDSTFAPTGLDATEYTDIVLVGGDRILLAGNFTRVGATNVATRLVRLTSNGALDPTFTAPAFANTPTGIYLAGDGRIFLTGQNGFVLGENSIVVQLTSGGAVDRNFSLSLNATARDLAEDAAGRLYLLTTSQLLRLTRNGGIDRAVTVQSNPQALLGAGDRLLVAGGNGLTAIGGVSVFGLSYTNAGDTDALALLTPLPDALTVAQGGVLALRPAFRGGDGATTYQWFRDGNAIDGATGPSLVIANASTTDAGAYRVTATRGSDVLTAGPTQVTVRTNNARPGEVDLAWGAGLSVVGGARPYSDAANNIYLVGNVQLGAAAARPLVALAPDGTARGDFTLSAQVTGVAAGLRFQSDGKLLLFGGTVGVDGVSRVVRLNVDGSVDPTFGVIGASNDVIPLDDGRILVSAGSGLQRYSAAGVLDGSFDVGAFASGSFHVAPDGKRWLVGSLNDSVGNNHWLARLNADGTIDPTFVGPILRSSEFINGFVGAADGSLFVILNWSNSSQSGYGSDYRRIVRVRPDGTIDANFTPGVFAFASGSASYSEMAVDAAGRLIVVGVFSSYDGLPRNGIVRLLADGAPDPSFANLPATTAVSSNTVPQRVTVQPSGRILVSNSSGAALGGVTDRLGLFALVGTELPSSVAPEITGTFADLSLSPYGILSLAAPVLAPANATFQWFKDGDAIVGATASRYRLSGAPSSAAGDYTVRVTTTGGTVQTTPVTVSVPPTDYSGALSALNAVTRIDTPALFGVRQPDGRALVVSIGSSVNGSANYELFRLNADGTFAGGLPTVITGSNSSPVVSCALVDAQGRIYLGGQFTKVNGVTRNRVVRLLADGTVDPVWDPGTGPNSTVTSLALTSDGRLVIGGSFSQVAGVARQYLARLTAAGALDTTFLVGTGLNNPNPTLLMSPDDRVIVGGAFTTYNGLTATRLIRLDASGALDATFAPAPNSTVNFISAATDGRLLIGGNFTQVGGVARTGLAWLGADGALLPATANLTTGYTSALALPDDSIVASTPNGLYRFRADGTADTLFNNANGYRGQFYRGYATTATSSRAAPLLANGNQILLVGDIGRIGGAVNSATSNIRHAAVWIQYTDALTPVIGTAPADAELPEGGSITWSVAASTPTGVLTYAWTKVSDPTTILSTTAALARTNVKPADAGQYRIVVANGEGYAEAFVNLSVRSAALPRAGSVRLGFNATATGTDVRDLVAAANGNWWTITSTRLLRLLPDGSADSSFAALEVNSGGSLTGLHPLPDGRLYAWGTFSTLAGQAVKRLVRLTADGALDPTFNADLPSNAVISDVAELGDGRIYVGGNFTVDIAGSSARNLVRLASTGAIDPTFDPAGGLDATPMAVRALADGRVLVAGPFTTAGGASRRGVVRFLSTGPLDTGFNNLNVANVYQLLVYPDGRLLIAGQFTTVDGVARAGVARLTADGVVDPTFTLGATANFNSTIVPIVLRPDGRIVIAGSFTESAGTRSRVLQFGPDGVLDPTYDGTRSFTSTAGGISSTSFRDLALLPTGHLIVVGSFSFLDDGISRAGLASLQGTPLAPEITADTIASATLSAGGTINLSVTASGAPTLGYQWRHNTSAIDGATSPTFTKANVTAEDAGTYDVVVTNSYGTATSRSAVIALTQEAQTITFAALSDVPFSATPLTLEATASSGLTVVFSVVSGSASVAGNQLTLLGTGAITIRATQPGNGGYLAAAPVERTFNVTANFASWLVDNFTPTEIADPTQTGPNADYDHDGLSNLVEYALGLNPKAASPAGAPALTLENGQWTLTYTRPANRTDVTYAVQFSTNLTSWSATGVTHTLVSTVGGVATWRATYPATAAPHCFLRLMVTR
ncbi:MAG: hypothetical protein KF715_18715 [Candidatus Didemnitutus sp.]|nr:hypothetical protein [Candidatus Didemnitutus sp.]